MGTITIGLDLAKNVFQVQGVDVDGAVTVRKTLRPAQVRPFNHLMIRCLSRTSICTIAKTDEMDTLDPRLCS